MKTRQNKNNEKLLSHEYLSSIMTYDIHTGLFTRIYKTNNNTNLSKPAGTVDSTGYIRIKINGIKYMAHRLAYFMVNKSWPKNLIDHIDGKKKNNIYTNLRQATVSENARNSKPHIDNPTGTKGVYYSKTRKKYIAEICTNYKTKYLGGYDTISEAKDVYNTAAKKYHGKFVYKSN